MFSAGLETRQKYTVPGPGLVGLDLFIGLPSIVPRPRSSVLYLTRTWSWYTEYISIIATL